MPPHVAGESDSDSDSFDVVDDLLGDGDCPFSLSDEDEDGGGHDDKRAGEGGRGSKGPLLQSAGAADAGDDTPTTKAPTLFEQMPALHPKSLRDVSPAGALALLSDPTYWRGICPKLHLSDPTLLAKAEGAVVQSSKAHVDKCRARMHRDGYFDLPAGHVDWAVDLAVLADGVAQLEALGWPPNFILMYDEAWLLADQLKELLLQVTGNRLIFDFSVFHVSGSKSASRGGAPAGWPPHRDRGADSSAKRFRHDGTPEYATAWIALTPATPTNSCLYVVPKEHDVGYLGGDDGRNPLSAIFKSPLAFQHIRALPCDPGAVVVFSHRLLHWGSSADEKARQDKGGEPARVALSFASASPLFEKPFVKADVLPLPRPETRAALVCGLAILYIGNVDPGEDCLSTFWACFRGGRDSFDEGFAKLVEQNHAAYQSSAGH